MRALPHPTTATDSVGATQSGVWARADGRHPPTAEPRARAGRKPTGPAESSRWAGRALDHYELEERIGQGAMGEVHAARDRSLDRPVAIKVLRPRLATNPQLKTRFVREARAQARLRSPHVTAIYHVGSTPPSADGSSTLYFAMEHVAGGALEAILERGERLSPERARQLLIQAVRGLRDAHRAGIIHRDIKPGNLLLDEDGILKIADFGVAKSLNELGITGKDTVIGSPYTMPPEQ
ncbi:MAG: serine/threonine protein kinase, partial [Deltaproteobacteria bacterium]|nr:serine/threonine protein kinase [Deltaproteobacteria bacterium]